MAQCVNRKRAAIFDKGKMYAILNEALCRHRDGPAYTSCSPDDKGTCLFGTACYVSWSPQAHSNDTKILINGAAELGINALTTAVDF